MLGDSDDEDVNEVAASNGDKKKKTTKPGGFKSDSNSVIDLTDDQPNQLIALRPRVPSIALCMAKHRRK